MGNRVRILILTSMFSFVGVSAFAYTEVVGPPIAGPTNPVPLAEEYVGADPSGPLPTDDQAKCRQWEMIESREMTQRDPSTGKYVKVPYEKWDWVDVPCGNGEVESGWQVDDDVPTKYVFSTPPSVAEIPGTYAYVVPDVDLDILFYHGYWYRPYRGKWYRARSYNGPWLHLAFGSVPRVVINLPFGYRRLAHGYHRIPYGHLHDNWRKWEKNRHGKIDKGWRKFENRKRWHR